MKTALAFAALALALTQTPFASACGESSFRSATGMRYHAFITREPANVLIYRPSSSNGDDSARRLAAGLQRAGHHITIVADETTMATALIEHHFDVVIASARDMDAISSRLDKSSREPALLAVVGSDGLPAQSDHLTYTVHESDGLNQYLKSIEQTMHARGS